MLTSKEAVQPVIKSTAKPAVQRPATTPIPNDTLADSALHDLLSVDAPVPAVSRSPRDSDEGTPAPGATPTEEPHVGGDVDEDGVGLDDGHLVVAVTLEEQSAGLAQAVLADLQCEGPRAPSPGIAELTQPAQPAQPEVVR